MSTIRVFRKHIAKVGQLAVAALLIGSPLCFQAHAQTINFGSATKLADNVANQGSPTVIYCGGQLAMYYVNHGNSTIYVDAGLTGNFQSTGITVYTGGITDVGASCSGSETLLFYIDGALTPRYAYSSGPNSFHGFYAISTGSSGFNSLFVPTPANAPSGATYFVLVGNNNYIYSYSVIPGESAVYLRQVSPYATESRPALTLYNGAVYLGFLKAAGAPSVAYVGDIFTLSFYEVSNIEWGNSNHSGGYASIGLVQYGAYLYAFGQDYQSSQHLKYAYSSNGSSWSGPTTMSTQMRWTSSLTVDTASNQLYLVYQDDGDTNISYQYN
jgi:hypothetical protein